MHPVLGRKLGRAGRSYAKIAAVGLAIGLAMALCASFAKYRSELKISVVRFICQIVVRNIVNVITLFKFLDKPVDLSSILINLFKCSENSFLVVRGKALSIHKIHQLIEVRSFLQ